MNEHVTRLFPARATWLIVGGSPSVSGWFGPAVRLCGGAVRVTSNAGGPLFADARQRLDLWWYSDVTAYERWGHRKAEVRQATGCRIVTQRRSEEGLSARGLLDADVLLNFADLNGDREHVRYEPGAWSWPRLSGLILTLLALECRAARLVLLGMEGYQSGPGRHVVDNFDGRIGKDGSAAHVTHWIAPFFNAAIAAHRDTEFLFCGPPTYPIEMRGRGFHPSGMGVGNVAILGSPAALERCLASPPPPEAPR
jgi:hypothetical protein